MSRLVDGGRRRAAWLVGALLALALAGCGTSAVAVPSTDANPSTTVAPTTSSTVFTTTTTTATGSGAAIDGSSTGRLPTLPTPTRPVNLPNPSTPTGQQQFITQVFNDIQTTWKNAFAQAGLPYSPARLVLFRTVVTTACGTQTSDVGPFYCPADATVYIDLQFFTDLEQRLGVTGDFSQAYVIAHEMGHHIQNLLGITGRVATTEHADPADANALSVSVELQADCFAGVWAHTTYTRNLLEPGDLDEALNAAGAVGDDFLQQLTGSEAEPENWTHGSSAQRQQWLTTGFDTGSPEACNTFG